MSLRNFIIHFYICIYAFRKVIPHIIRWHWVIVCWAMRTFVCKMSDIYFNTREFCLSYNNNNNNYDYNHLWIYICTIYMNYGNTMRYYMCTIFFLSLFVISFILRKNDVSSFECVSFSLKLFLYLSKHVLSQWKIRSLWCDSHTHTHTEEGQTHKHSHIHTVKCSEKCQQIAI